MSALCEMMKLHVESGHIERALMWDSETGATGSVYGIRLRKQRGDRHPAALIMLRFCPACGTEQNTEFANGPVGLFCKEAGVPVVGRELLEKP